MPFRRQFAGKMRSERRSMGLAPLDGLLSHVWVTVVFAPPCFFAPPCVGAESWQGRHGQKFFRRTKLLSSTSPAAWFVVASCWAPTTTPTQVTPAQSVLRCQVNRRPTRLRGSCAQPNSCLCAIAVLNLCKNLVNDSGWQNAG